MEKVIKIFYKVLFTGVFLCFLSGDAFANKPHIAVLHIKGTRVSASLPNILRNLIEKELYKKNLYKILERGQIRQAFKQKKLNKYSCNDENCALVVGKSVLSDFVIIGTVEKTDNYIFSFEIISTLEGTSLFSYKKQTGLKDSLEKFVVNLVNRFDEDLKRYQVIKKSDKYDEFVKRIKEQKFQKNNNLYGYIQGIYYLPGKEFDDKAKPGWGLGIGFGINNFLFSCLRFGMESGYAQFDGDGKNAESVSFVPLLLSVQYPFSIAINMNISPHVKFGYHYFTINRISNEIINSDPLETRDVINKKSVFSNLLIMGFNIEYALSRQYSLFFGSALDTIFELKSLVFIYQFNAGVSYIF